MTTLFTLLFVSTLAVPPSAYLETEKNGSVSYICYIENDNLMLAKVENDVAQLHTLIIDTGISTNSIEKITLSLQNDNICISSTYTNTDPLNAYFNSSSLEFEQINVSQLNSTANISALIE